LGTLIVQDNNPRKTKFTFEAAVDVWLRRRNGQLIHEIAAAYVINSGAPVTCSMRRHTPEARKLRHLGAPPETF
jgi:hypothetical protein